MTQDCNGNAAEDSEDIARGLSADCNGNGIPDECDVSRRLQLRVPQRIPLERDVSAVLAEDFDGDLDLDFAVVSGPSGSHSVVMLLNLGDGSFHPAVQYSLPASPSSLNAADLNADGKPDVAVSMTSLCCPNGQPGTLLLLNDGRGGLRTGPFLAAERPGVEPNYVLPVDLDNDDDADLVVANGGRPSIAIFRGNGNGTFDQASILESAEELVYLGAGDLDGDADLDIAGAATGSATDTVVVLANDGAGTLTRSIGLNAGFDADSILVSDLDGDGRSDITARSPLALVVFWGEATGGFSASERYVLPGGRGAASVGDIDGDSDLDVIVPGFTSGDLLMFLNEGRRTFSEPVAHQFMLVPHVALPVDLDGDMDADIAVFSGGSNRPFLTIVENEGRGVFAVPMVLETDFAERFAIADLNGDGISDFVLANQNIINGVLVVLSHPDGSLGPAIRQVWFSRYGGAPKEIQTGDLDGDSDVDVAVFTEGDPIGTVAVLLNNGKGELALSVARAITNSPRNLVLFDLNGDGRLDAAVSCSGGASQGGIRFLWNRGDGFLTSGEFLNLPGSAGPIAGGDFDGDGDADLILYVDLDFTLLRNGGGGVFSRERRQDLKIRSQAFPGDFDGDEDLDFVAQTEGMQSDLAVFINRGDATFTVGETVSHQLRVSDLFYWAVDIDGDRDLDLLGRKESISIFLNNGGATFEKERHYEGQEDRRVEPLFDDLDGDGRMDLLFLSRGRLFFAKNQTAAQESRDINANRMPDECESEFFHRGDVNDDGRMNITDAILVLTFLFAGGVKPRCVETADVDNDTQVVTTDAIRILNFLFLAGPSPAPPGPTGHACGVDPDPPSSEGDLGCEAYTSCP
jgi:hypothetical protein